jgi:hypothetical protein
MHGVPSSELQREENKKKKEQKRKDTYCKVDMKIIITCGESSRPVMNDTPPHPPPPPTHTSNAV